MFRVEDGTMVDLTNLDKQTLARYFDYAILPKNTREKDIRRACALARTYRFAAFYTSSAFWTPLVKEELADIDDIEIGAGIAFPFGSAPPSVKAFEMEDAIKKGCNALDMVMNIGALKDKNYRVVEEELRLFKRTAGDSVTKCILEVCFLEDEEIRIACELIAEAGIGYAKTASGQFDGPSMEQFLLMKRTLTNTDVKIKVSGVKFPRPQNALVFIKAGADRIGSRAAPEIVDSLPMMREIGLVP